MVESRLAAPIGLPVDRVDGRLKVTGQGALCLRICRAGRRPLRGHRSCVDRQRSRRRS
jgi:hypothetical protein